jgi:hypothetical protein
VVVGIVVGAGVNMGLVVIGSSVVPAPAGVDVTDAESIAAALHLFEPIHFFFPFLAHAGGTFVGALLAYVIAHTYRNQLAFAVGALFFMGGISVAFMIPAPAWFIAADLILAYFPMAFLATRIGARIRK